MKTLTRITALTLVAALTVASLGASPAVASHPKALLIQPGPGPGPGFHLPKFGFNSYNIAGIGERITHVRWGSLAAQLGLEPRDIITDMNGYPLTYHGAWNDALYHAMLNGGWVQLTIRDWRTGFHVQRYAFVGNGIGPVTPYVVHHHPGYGYPSGPITAKSMKGPQPGPHHGGQQSAHLTVKQIVDLFKKKP